MQKNLYLCTIFHNIMAETQEKWTTEIRPKDKLLSVDFKEIWQYRDLMMLFVKRNIITQYKQTVKPMHEMYVEPSKKFADLVVPEGGKNQVALDMIEGRIQRHLEG